MWLHLYSHKVTILVTYSLVPEAMTSFISTIFYCGSKHHICFLKKPLNDILRSYSNIFYRLSDSQCEMVK